MMTYRVHVSIHGTMAISVEADNESEARTAAMDVAFERPTKDWETSMIQVEEVKEAAE